MYSLKKTQPSIFAIFTGLPCSLSSINAFVAELQHGIIPLDSSHVRNGPEWGSKYALRTWLWVCFHLYHGPGSTLGISPEMWLWNLHFKQIHQVTGSMLTGGNSCLQKPSLKQDSQAKTWSMHSLTLRLCFITCPDSLYDHNWCKPHFTATTDASPTLLVYVGEGGAWTWGGTLIPFPWTASEGLCAS